MVVMSGHLAVAADLTITDVLRLVDDVDTVMADLPITPTRIVLKLTATDRRRNQAKIPGTLVCSPQGDYERTTKKKNSAIRKSDNTRPVI